MASSSTGSLLLSIACLLLVLPLIATVAMAQQPSSDGSTCSGAIVSLSPCLAFITATSSSSRRPSASCCSQLSNLVQATPQCLCTAMTALIGSSGPSFVTINRTMAFNLPGACKSTTPPLAQCTKPGEDAPVGSPPESSPAPTESTVNDTPVPVDITPTDSDYPSTDTDDDGGSTSNAKASSSQQAMLLGLLLVATICLFII